MSQKKKIRLFVFIDALGWDIVERHHAFSWLDAYRKPARTILGYSCTCIPSILSGQWPQDHGHWTFFHKAKEKSPLHGLRHLKHLPKKLSHHHRFRHWLSQSFARRTRFTGYFNLYHLPYRDMPFFDYVEKKDLYSTKESDIRTIFNDLEESGVPYFCADWRAPEEENIANLRRDLQQTSSEWAFLYLPRLDGIMHQAGPEGAAAHLRWYEGQLRQLLDDFAETHEIKTTVFSDHGMTKIHRHLNIAEQDATTDPDVAPDVNAFYDATLARYWFRSEEARRRVEQALEACPYGRILSREELEAEKVWFADQRFGELIFLADPGVLLYPNHMGAHPPLGMHGFSPDDKDSTAAVLSDDARALDVLGQAPSIRDYYTWMKDGSCA